MEVALRYGLAANARFRQLAHRLSVACCEQVARQCAEAASGDLAPTHAVLRRVVGVATRCGLGAEELLAVARSMLPLPAPLSAYAMQLALLLPAARAESDVLLPLLLRDAATATAVLQVLADGATGTKTVLASSAPADSTAVGHGTHTTREVLLAAAWRALDAKGHYAWLQGSKHMSALVDFLITTKSIQRLVRAR